MNHLTEIPTRPPREALPHVEAANRLVDRLSYHQLLVALDRAQHAPSDSLRRHYARAAATIAERFVPVPA